MTKSDLKTGMLVTCKNGSKYLVLLNVWNVDILLNQCGYGGFVGLSGYKNDLTHEYDSEFDIIEVKKPALYTEIRTFFTKPESTNCSTIWTRPVEKKKYTYSQLKEILGEEFEIVKD